MREPVIIQVRDLKPGDVVMWDEKLRFVEAIDKSFCASVKVKLHDLFLVKHWAPDQQIIKFDGLPLEIEGI